MLSIAMKQKNYLITDLKKIFKKELKVSVKENGKIYDFIQWDSLGNFNILLACEKKFKIKFTNNQFTTVQSFEGINKAIIKKLK